MTAARTLTLIAIILASSTSLGSNAARDVLGSVASLASAVVVTPLRLLTGSFDELPSAVESFFDLPAISFASQRVSDLTIDLTQLQLFGEQVLGIEQICKPADFRPASRQPAAIEGPTLSITFHSLNCSVEDNTSFGATHLLHNKTIHINTTFACDKGVITYEKVCTVHGGQPEPAPLLAQTPLILRKQFHRGERYRCAECVIQKQVGEEREIVLFEGGDKKVFDSVAAFLNATDLGTVLPFRSLSLGLSSQVQQLLNNNAALLGNVLELQRRVTAIGNGLLEGYDNAVNAPLDKALNRTLAAQVWGIEKIFDLLK